MKIKHYHTELIVPPIDINVNYHGSLHNRQYIVREDILKKFKYNPIKDTLLLSGGNYELKNKKLENEIKEYFSPVKKMITLNNTPSAYQAPQEIFKFKL